MKKKIFIVKILVIFINVIVLFRLFSICVIDHLKYKNLFLSTNEKIIESHTTLRGKILDCNGNILVDNKGIKVLYYTRIPNISYVEEMDIAYKLSKIIELDKINITEMEKREYIYKKYKDEIDKRINKEKMKKYNERKINENEYINYKYSLINEEEEKSVSDAEIYIYTLMNKGYSYQDKVIKKNISDKEFTLINELNLKGIRIDIDYVRVYRYDTSLNQIFGSIGYIEKENKDYYLNKGYKLDSVVGVSFLEKTYEDVLRGKARTYKIKSDNTLELIDEGRKGNDLVLTIDIEKQLKIDEILKEEIINAKKVPSSKYFNGSSIVVSDPTNGHIIALSSYTYEGSAFNYNTIGILKNSYTVGSVVKAASMSTLYKYNANLDKVRDGCVKLKNQTEKCSWKDLGVINDIDALANSSNYYQFLGAIKLSGYEYSYNMEFSPTILDFNKYRDYFKTLGLGSKTNIDIDGEEEGIIGKKISGDLLLNLSIGQYDTYTPLMLNSYIATVANGKYRYKLKIADSIITEDSLKEIINKDEILNEYDIKSENLERIKKGLRKVVTNGTASSYIEKKYNGSGKTGTSETYFNGINTTTKSFVAYVPSDNPEYAITIVSPNISYKLSSSNYKYPINSRLSRKITHILFEN